MIPQLKPPAFPEHREYGWYLVQPGIDALAETHPETTTDPLVEG
jgi:hypothetical protein